MQNNITPQAQVQHLTANLSNAAGNLDRALTDLIARATDAQRRLREGKRVSAGAVLGQPATDVEIYAGHLNALLEFAPAMLTAEQIQDATKP